MFSPSSSASEPLNTTVSTWVEKWDAFNIIHHNIPGKSDSIPGAGQNRRPPELQQLPSHPRPSDPPRRCWRTRSRRRRWNWNCYWCRSRVHQVKQRRPVKIMSMLTHDPTLMSMFMRLGDGSIPGWIHQHHSTSSFLLLLRSLKCIQW